MLRNHEIDILQHDNATHRVLDYCTFSIHSVWYLEYFCHFTALYHCIFCNCSLRTYLASAYCFYICIFHIPYWNHCSGLCHISGCNCQCKFDFVDLSFCHLLHMVVSFFFWSLWRCYFLDLQIFLRVWFNFFCVLSCFEG